MNIVRFKDGEATQIYSNPGFTLAGLGVDPHGHIYWGQRTTDETSGMYRFNVEANAVEGPWKTELPPMDFLFY